MPTASKNARRHLLRRMGAQPSSSPKGIGARGRALNRTGAFPYLLLWCSSRIFSGNAGAIQQCHDALQPEREAWISTPWIHFHQKTLSGPTCKEMPSAADLRQRNVHQTMHSQHALQTAYCSHWTVGSMRQDAGLAEWFELFISFPSHCLPLSSALGLAQS